MVKFLCCVGLCLLAGASGIAQDAPSQPAAQKKGNTYFAGTVTEAAADHISVTRRISGKQDKRTFRITPQTKIEGKLQARVRVTVQYVVDDQGVITATRVVVHAAPAKK